MQNGAGVWSRFVRCKVTARGWVLRLPCLVSPSMAGPGWQGGEAQRGRYSLVVLPVHDVAHIWHLIRRHCRAAGAEKTGTDEQGVWVMVSSIRLLHGHVAAGQPLHWQRAGSEEC
jgi:hypothetical protein